MSERIGHWINGQTALGVSGLDGPVFDPATGRESARVAYANVQDVDEAVANAHAAFPQWRATSLALRTQVMFSFRSLASLAVRDSII